MREELTIRIAGEAGQGIETVGMALARIFKKAGFHIFANQDYMSRIRGGNNFFQIRIANREMFTHRLMSDITVALNKKSVALHKEALHKGGSILLDKAKSGITENDTRLFDIPFHDLAVRAGGKDLFINTVSCGAVVGMTGTPFTYVEEIVRDIFSNKGEEIIKQNVAAAKAGFEFVRERSKKDRIALPAGGGRRTLLMNGNEAIALGAIRAGCKFYTAYPMTPSTGILNAMAHYAKRFGIVVEQAEDEIAAVNMAIGASYAGVRSMTATSGGGFALMAEGISLAGMVETPLVVACVQRPAPATGFPTRTEQADLDFLLHSGHGEFSRAVYSPGTIEEAFYLTVKAFNIADKYQIPVLIMSDQHLADSYRDIEPFDTAKARVERYIVSKEDSGAVKNYKRYQLTDSGISPRAVPSWIDDPVYCDSDEHTEEGHITEDASTRIAMVEKRLYKKTAGLSGEVEKPASYNIDRADRILIGFGSTYGVMKEASETMKGGKTGFIHCSQVWPFPAREMTRLLKGAKNILTVEGNAGAQFGRLLKRETGISVNGAVLRFDGRPFDLDYLMEKL
ncbi:MAG: 2-oxoacid:acceptor oxidoreductase subunit alpha [Candidatus Omnitrophica bacterium]|nr:2-oxoacid:acceptor oxidoreductase subunit alpha [Candidatus Omnitrophota bacterium]